MIDNDNNHDKHEDEMMIPFSSIASRDSSIVSLMINLLLKYQDTAR